MNKPHWMTNETWVFFVEKYGRNGVFECATCHTTEHLSVDHIKPRIDGGNDSIMNLQPMCVPCNSRKYTHPDEYWKQRMYFDFPLAEDKLRISQNEFIYDIIKQRSEFFSKPWSSINGKLFMFAQIVGAGKTLGIAALASALNQCFEVGQPRVNQLLIVTKDKQLRAQIAAELRDELVQYGISRVAPIVVELNSGALIANPPAHDIAIMCPNMLWPDVDYGDDDAVEITWKPETKLILDRYPLIAFDEMHYAYQQISMLVKMASRSLVFGVTASPIDGAGELLDDIVRMSVFDYSAACIHDKSMKWLGEKDSAEYKPVTYVDVDDWKTFDGWIGSAESNGLATEMVSVATVVNSTIKRVWELDNRKEVSILAPHRDASLFKVGESYPAHAIVVVSDIATANDVQDHMNLVFSKHRDKYPVSMGWKALAVHSKGDQKFDDSHPFFYYKNTGKANSHMARFLIVVDMATEGMNNKYATVMGVAKRTESIREMVQRLGRLLRSAHYEDLGVLYAPPIHHDRVHVITHKEFTTGVGETAVGNEPTVTAAFDFLNDMIAHTDELMDIDEYIESGDKLMDMDMSVRVSISGPERLIIGDLVGKAILEGKPVPMGMIHKAIPTKKKAKRHLITNAAVGLYNRNQGEIELLIKGIFNCNLIDPVKVALDDKVQVKKLTAITAPPFVKSYSMENVIEGLSDDFDSPAVFAMLDKINSLLDSQHRDTAFTTRVTAISVIEELTASVHRTTRLPASDMDTVAGYIHDATLRYLEREGATLNDLIDGGRLNVAAVVLQLRKPRFQSNARMWTIWQLYKNKKLKHIAAIVGDLTAENVKNYRKSEPVM